MTIETTRTFLLWCTVIDYAVLLVWFFVFVFAHDGFSVSMADGFASPLSNSTPSTTWG